MLYGYAGKLLFVDLQNRTIEEKKLAPDIAEKFLGGYGIGAKVLYDNMPAKADPLGPDSILGFVCGLANGTKAFFSGRYTLVHKSPITGGWNDANSGGYFGPELKKAGFDAVFVRGISEQPVYLWINDGKVEIRDATFLWGKNTKETLEILKQEIGDPRIKVVAIGPAGEKRALISCPINDGHRAPGRGGGGAVMGSKKLKAIAVRGTRNISVANPDEIIKINKIVSASLKGAPQAEGMRVYGTGVSTSTSALIGDAPIKNWDGIGIFDYGEESAKKVGAPRFDNKYKIKKYFCANCPLGCGAVYKVEDGRWPLPETERPEYETVAAFGPNLLCDEMGAVFKCNEICNTYGIDTISAGATIAWAMECYDKGILSREELDGIDLKWGDGEAIVELMQKMADGDGIGEILMHGSAYAAKKLGKGEEYLQTTWGLELPMHDPRLAPGFARTYQYDPTPARHVKGGLGLPQLMGLGMPGNMESLREDNITKLDVKMTSFREVTNASGFCFFMDSGADPGLINNYIEAITGKVFSPETSYEAGFRIFTLRHAFNLREGLTRKDMQIAGRAVGKPPQNEGPIAGKTVDNERLADNFFAFLGWDKETLKPALRELEKLGLEEVAKNLYL